MNNPRNNLVFKSFNIKEKEVDQIFIDVEDGESIISMYSFKKRVDKVFKPTILEISLSDTCLFINDISEIGIIYNKEKNTIHNPYKNLDIKTLRLSLPSGLFHLIYSDDSSDIIEIGSVISSFIRNNLFEKV